MQPKERPRRTKILATLGPATPPQELDRLVATGIDAVRINLSHGTHQEHAARIQALREASARAKREIAVLADLQGPKIRIQGFQSDHVQLDNQTPFILDPQLAPRDGDATQVGINYPSLPHEVTPGDILLIDDGRIRLEILTVHDNRIHTRVLEGGRLTHNKGLNRLGGGLSAHGLSDKDKDDLQAAMAWGVDLVAISFVASADDVIAARKIIHRTHPHIALVAKIERQEAIEEDTLDAIILASDLVMVARGDLGVEIGDYELPRIQKHIIARARALDRGVITATQMMASMISETLPTRAEVFDVANAVLDGTDAVMLSNETAVGQHPSKVVAAVSRICLGTESQAITRTSGHRLECRFHRVDEAIAMATMYTANHIDVQAIITFTESGATPIWMSRIRSGIPIYAFSPNIATLRKMTLYRGVYPIYHARPAEPISNSDLVQTAIATLKSLDIVTTSDTVVITYGDHQNLSGNTDTMQLVHVS